MSKSRPLVYVASPYSKGDPAINTKFQLDVFHQLMDSGIVYPICPLASHFFHLHSPRSWQDWMDYDLELVSRCDALVRLNASASGRIGSYHVQESKGADTEVEHARRLDIPVFFSINSMLSWAETQRAA